MASWLKWVLFVAGFAGYFIVLASVAKTLVIPRGTRSWVSKLVDSSTDLVYRKLGNLTDSYEARDRFRASQPVVIIFLRLILWMLLLWIVLAAMTDPFVPGFLKALREAESSLLTLGFSATDNVGASLVDFLGGFTGLSIVALQISYLPTLYAAFNRRETEVAVLVARAGEPPWGPEMLARTRVGFLDTDLSDLYHSWERWAAEVAETHSTYPILLRFRSPDPYTSWLVSLLCVMDAAALHLALAPSDAPVEARLCLRMGFVCLRQIAATVGLQFDPDPRPDDDIMLTFDEFVEAENHLREVGFPIEVDLEHAWLEFRGWRVNYESIAIQLARRIDAVPALWSRAPDDPVKPISTRWVRNRTHDDPEGRRGPRLGGQS